MLECCYRPLERCFGTELSGSDALLWHMDLKQHASGDYSIAVVQANSSLEDQAQVFTSPQTTYVGVYDGHGGPEASRFITNHLFAYLHKFTSEQGGLSAEVIRRAFGATENDFLRLVKQSWLEQPHIASVGSCCLVGAISNGVLYVANLGDSRAVLGRRMTSSSTVLAERLSTDHNVAFEEVRKEVRAMHPDDSTMVVYTRGVWRIKGIIQVSRSIGDVYLKKPELVRDPFPLQYASRVPLKKAVMTAEPSIITHKLRPEDLFVIFASDGLWEQITDQTAVEIVLKYPRTGIAKRLVRAAIEEAARKRQMRYDDIRRLEKGIRRHFHDDITVVVIYMDQQQNFPNGNPTDHFVADCTSAPMDIYSFNSEEGESTPYIPS